MFEFPQKPPFENNGLLNQNWNIKFPISRVCEPHFLELSAENPEFLSIWELEWTLFGTQRKKLHGESACEGLQRSFFQAVSNHYFPDLWSMFRLAISVEMLKHMCLFHGAWFDLGYSICRLWQFLFATKFAHCS